MENIDLSRYRQSGEGANGASYNSLSDPSEMLKLYNVGYQMEPIIRELEVAGKVYDFGIPTPKPGELVTDGERVGIRFHRIAGKRSYSRMLADEPGRVDELSREFTRLYKKLHSTVCPKGLFPDVKEQYALFLEKDKVLNPAQKKTVAAFIDTVPDMDYCLHGDMHIGNVISTLPVGADLSTPHELYFIDIGCFGSGNPLFDIGMHQQVCLYADEEFRRHDFHVGYDITSRLWDSFVDEYFFAEDDLATKYFGPGQTPESIEKALKPYMCCKYLFMEYCMGFLPEPLVSIMKDTFNF